MKKTSIAISLLMAAGFSITYDASAATSTAVVTNAANQPAPASTATTTAPVQESAPVTKTETAPVTPAPKETAPETEKKTVKIMHTNDMHGRLDEEPDRVIGMAKVKTIKEKEKPTLMLDSGDAFQGLPLSNYSKGKDMAKAMNAVGYDAMTVGNHEFDFGYKTAMSYKKLLNFPIISSNIVKDGKNIFAPSTIVKRDGVKYGIVGVTTPETKTKTHPNNVKGVSFLDPVSSVTSEMKKLSKKVDSYVILSHLGIDTTTNEKWRGDYLTKAIAANKMFNDRPIVVLDGHSHSVLENGKLVKSAMVAQTGTALQNIGVVTYDLNDKKTENMKAQMINVQSTKDVTPDPEVKKLIDTAKNKYNEATSEVVFHNPVLLQGEREYVRTQETNLGNAITDAMEDYSTTGFQTAGDFAVTNGGGIRASIEGEKDVTIGDIIKVLPFGNTITQIEVSGTDIQKMFEHALSAPTIEKEGKTSLDANGAFLHVSKSVRVHYDMTKEAGERVYFVEVYDKSAKKFLPLDKKKMYKLVTNDFLAVGGDGFTMLGGKREEGPSLDNVVRQYFAKTDMKQYATDEITRILNGDSSKFEMPVTDIEDTSTEDKVDVKEDTKDIPTTNDVIKEEPDFAPVEMPAAAVNPVAVPISTDVKDIVKTQVTAPSHSVSDNSVRAEQEKSVTTEENTLPATGEPFSPAAAGVLLVTGLYFLRKKSA